MRFIQENMWIISAFVLENFIWKSLRLKAVIFILKKSSVYQQLINPKNSFFNRADFLG
jgi:hypothetical protein